MDVIDLVNVNGDTTTDQEEKNDDETELQEGPVVIAYDGAANDADNDHSSPTGKEFTLSHWLHWVR
jgi:hypothetical protein